MSITSILNRVACCSLATATVWKLIGPNSFISKQIKMKVDNLGFHLPAEGFKLGLPLFVYILWQSGVYSYEEKQPEEHQIKELGAIQTIPSTEE